MYKKILTSFLLIASVNVASEDYYELPNEVWSCIGDTPSFSISPNGKYLAIQRAPREDVCDIEQDKEKQVEDETRYRSLTFIDLETMQSKIFSDGIGEKSIYGFQWVSDDRFIYRPGLTNAKGRNMNALVTIAVNVDGSCISAVDFPIGIPLPSRLSPGIPETSTSQKQPKNSPSSSPQKPPAFQGSARTTTLE